MKHILFSGFLALTAVFFVNAQTPLQETVQSDSATSDVRVENAKTEVPPETPDAKGPLPVIPAQNTYVRPDSKTRFNRYLKSMFGPMALGKNVVSAGYGTWRNSPEEWGDQWEGFGKRFASSVGKGVIKNTTSFALEETFKLDSHYYRSQKKDFGSKLGNALISPVTARNKEGKRVFGFPRIIGTYTASIIAAETWYPSRYNYKDGLKSGTISLGMTAAFNIVKEFIWK